MESSQFPTPQEALKRLKEGNKRFVSGVRSIDPLLAPQKMKELAEKGQKPFAVILTCSDSRSPAEIIFDQGIGDLFVIRVAGNVVAPSLLASIEFAVANFGSSAVVVLGHTLCGAITATVRHTENPAKLLPSPHLEELIARIRPAVDSTVREENMDEADFMRSATIQNVQRSARLIVEQSRIVRTLVERGELVVEGALLDLSSGVVSFVS